MSQPLSLRLELQQLSPRKTNRFNVRIHHYHELGRKIQGWCVYDKSAAIDHCVVFKSHILAAVEDECARKNRADLF